ncbi:YqaA family protein [Dongia sp.]|uniref:YqaA family protein n=1 Tax=Dongia sp. TaxID=1977262 RepID=UPI003751D1EA
MDALTAYAGLFTAAFLSATILPGSSEVVLVMLALERKLDVTLLLLVATVANTLGSIVGWIMGRWFANLSGRRWFPASPAQMERASRWFGRYGVWALALAWVPLIGDALTIVAGVLRVHLGLFTALVGLGKALRYVAVLYGADILHAVMR